MLLIPIDDDFRFTSMHDIALDGTWRMTSTALARKGCEGLKSIRRQRGGWLRSLVPGDVRLDLMRAGLMEEPLVSLNTRKSRWPERRAWWYRRTFDVPHDFLAEERQLLVFDGLDYYAQVFLNDTFIGEARNALVPAAFDVRGIVRKDHNVLTVRITSGIECVRGSHVPHKWYPPEYRPRSAMIDVRGQLRKPVFSWGWDWSECLPAIGIWRPVRLEGRSGVILHDVRFDTVLEGDKASIAAEIIPENLHAWSERKALIRISIVSPRGERIRQELRTDLQVGRTPLRTRIPIADPQLWWPNGVGGQPLYGVEVAVKVGAEVTDVRRFRYGLRTVAVDQSPLPRGRRFCVQVNGQDVFCKGGNWVPADSIPARVDRARYRHLVEEARKANFTMLRVWGGGIYEDDAFYDACDEAGMLVFQDFMFACSDYAGTDPGFKAVVRAETDAAIRRLRHHACIALWCGNNENISWLPRKRGSQASLPIYCQVLPDVCRDLDPARFYWPSSPLGGRLPTSELAGDTHPWPYAMGPAHNLAADATDKWHTRFVTEFGAIGPPEMRTVRTYLKPAEMRPSSLAWRAHTNRFEKGFVRAAIDYHYGDADNMRLEKFIQYGGLAQAFIYRHQYEAQRFRRFDAHDDCQGFLIWMFNDCWGEIGWSIVDYYLRRKPAWYAARSACRPVKTLCRPRGGEMVTRIVNDTMRPHETEIIFGWWRLDGRGRVIRRRRLHLPPNSMREIFRDRIRFTGRERRQWVYAARLAGDSFEPDQCVWLMQPWRELDVPEPRVQIAQNGPQLILNSKVFCHQVHANDGGREIVNDNYFDLLPGEPVTIRRIDGRHTPLRFHAIGREGLVRIAGI